VTLGGSFTNFGTTVTTTFATGAAVSTTTVAPPAALFTQNYRLDQNGLLLGGVNVTATTTVDPSGVALRTSNVNAQINLNNGSITLDNITVGANTAANVNLNGSGFLGVAANDTSSTLTPGQIVTGFLPTPSLTRFLTVDPALGVTVPLMSGSRISGIQTVTKVGDGSFVIVGAPVVAATGTTPLVNTLDVATLRVSGGELQLGLATTTPTTNTFGIRGNVDNAASLVIGRRITDGTQTAVRGINLAVGGNLANAATGNLVVGVNPAFTRVNPAAPFAPFGQTPGIASVPSFVRVDGNLALAGAVDVVAPVGGIYEAGRAYDLFNVGGTFTNTSTVRSSLGSPFISFTLTPRSEGGRTIVSLNVARGNFDTVTTDRNSIAAARALQTALPGVFAGLRGGLAGSQDLASIVAAFDTRLPRTRVRRRSDTCRRANSMDRWPPSRPPFLLVRRSTVLQARDRQASDFGSAQPASSQPTRRTRPPARRASISIITADRSASTIPPDQARISALRADTARWTSVQPARLNAPKAGIYALQQLGGLRVSGQAVYGRSDWDASRGLPLFARTATSSFKSTEVRASLRVDYSIDINTGFELTPFARGEVRYFRFDGFDETGAGSIGLSVERRSKTVFTPEVGMRIGGSPDNGSRIRPFAEGSYLLQGDPGTDRVMNFLGDGATVFRAEGVRPDDAIKAAVGVTADMSRMTLFARADYASGGRQQVGSVRGGALFKF
jgi:hypothetical protein